MRIIDEIYRQRTILGLKQANRVILSHSAFQQLLAEEDELGLHQFNTQTIPPTVYGMSIIITDEPDREVTVLAGVPVVGHVVPDLIGEVSTEEAPQSSGSRVLAVEKPARSEVVRLSVELELLVVLTVSGERKAEQEVERGGYYKGSAATDRLAVP